jgi:hypothetical protein
VSSSGRQVKERRNDATRGRRGAVGCCRSSSSRPARGQGRYLAFAGAFAGTKVSLFQRQQNPANKCRSAVPKGMDEGHPGFNVCVCAAVIHGVENVAR